MPKHKRPELAAEPAAGTSNSSRGSVPTCAGRGLLGRMTREQLGPASRDRQSGDRTGFRRQPHRGCMAAQARRSTTLRVGAFSVRRRTPPTPGISRSGARLAPGEVGGSIGEASSSRARRSILAIDRRRAARRSTPPDAAHQCCGTPSGTSARRLGRAIGGWPGGGPRRYGRGRAPGASGRLLGRSGDSAKEPRAAGPVSEVFRTRFRDPPWPGFMR